MKEWICREMSTSTSGNENGVLMMETELIRCKDCKWHNTDEDECWLSGLDTDGYEYCSWAERKEE